MTDARRPDDDLTEPMRWSDDAGASSLERALLRAGQSGAMPAAEKHRLWAAIAGQVVSPPSVPAPAPGGTSAAGSAAGKLAGAGVLKGLSVVALVASGAGLWAYQTRDVATSRVVPGPTGSPAANLTAPPAKAVAPASVTNRVAPPQDVAPGGSIAPAGAGLVVPKDAARPGTAPAHRAASAVSPSSEPSPAPESRLSDEAHAVLAARAALRSGNPGAALRELADARALFPRGALVQEREALTIEALARAGQPEAASARAQTFLQRFPRSPHADDVRRFIVAR